MGRLPPPTDARQTVRRASFNFRSLFVDHSADVESCLALDMLNGPATPADRRTAYGAPRVFQLSFSFRRPLCRRGIVLDLPHDGLNPAHVSFR